LTRGEPPASSAAPLAGGRAKRAVLRAWLEDAARNQDLVRTDWRDGSEGLNPAEHVVSFALEAFVPEIERSGEHVRQARIRTRA